MKKPIAFILSVFCLCGLVSCAEPSAELTQTASGSAPTDAAPAVSVYNYTREEIAAIVKESIKKGVLPPYEFVNLLTADDLRKIDFPGGASGLYKYTKENHYKLDRNAWAKKYVSKEGDYGEFLYSSDGRILYDFQNYGNGMELSLTLKSVRVKDGVEIIFFGAFANEQFVEEIYLPSSVKFVATDAFKNCRNLKTVRFSADEPITVSNPFGYLEWGVGGGPTTLDMMRESIKIGIPLTCFPGEAPVTVNEKDDFVVENGVLVGYNGMGGDIVIPEGVREIRGGLFDHCVSNVASFTFPSTLEKVDGGFLTGRVDRLGIIEFPDSVKEFGRDVIVYKGGYRNLVYDAPIFVIVSGGCVCDPNAFVGYDGEERIELSLIRRS